MNIYNRLVNNSCDKMYQCGHCQKMNAWPSDLNSHVNHTHSNVAAAAPAVAAGPNLSAKSTLFHHLFSMTISKPTGSGQAFFLNSLLEECKISPKPYRIVYLCNRRHPQYELIKKTILNIDFIKDAFFDVKKTSLLIIDDMMSLDSQDPKITEMFMEVSHPRNLTVINRNTHFMVLFNSPMSQDQIQTLADVFFWEKRFSFKNNTMFGFTNNFVFSILDELANMFVNFIRRSSRSGNATMPSTDNPFFFFEIPI